MKPALHNARLTRLLDLFLRTGLSAAAMAASVSSAASNSAPSFLISHGTALHTLDAETACFRALRAEGARALSAAPPPRAVVVVSAHWATSSHPAAVGVGGATTPETIHDHPAQHLFAFRYPARGDAVLAERVAALLRGPGPGPGPGLGARVDPSRGLDHGAWLALELLFPGAPLPVVPVELPAGGGAEALARLGEALRALRGEGVALVFSGATTHNQDFFRGEFARRRLGMGGSVGELAARRAGVAEAEASVTVSAPWSVAFDAWVTNSLARETPAARLAALEGFADAPGSALAHPEPSHFLPLIAFAASSDVGGGAVKVAGGFQYGLSMSAFRFDA
jgi:4,5-DOPA dioxygenase extradiol